MAEFLSPVVGVIVNAMALFGAVSAVALALHLYRKKREVPAGSFQSDTLRKHIDNAAKTEQTAIESAVSGDNAADALAKLGNERRG